MRMSNQNRISYTHATCTYKICIQFKLCVTHTINHAISNRLTANLLNNVLSLRLIDRGIWFTVRSRCNEARYACMRFNNMTRFNAPHVNSFQFILPFSFHQVSGVYEPTANSNAPQIQTLIFFFVLPMSVLAANSYQTNRTHIDGGCWLPLLHHVLYSFRSEKKNHLRSLSHLRISVFLERHV